jgi:hypothetical protein
MSRAWSDSPISSPRWRLKSQVNLKLTTNCIIRKSQFQYRQSGIVMIIPINQYHGQNTRRLFNEEALILAQGFASF